MTQCNVANPYLSSNHFLNPKIYVACLASYNNGALHGCWCDATNDEDLIFDEIQSMLSNSSIPNAEEYAIHDFENFGSFRIEEYDSISTVHEVALFIQEHGDLGAELLTYLGDIESAQRALEDNYHGEYENELDFATYLFDECYAHDIPKNLQFYIDYEAFRRDLFINDYYSINVDGATHIFSYH